MTNIINSNLLFSMSVYDSDKFLVTPCSGLPAEVFNTLCDKLQGFPERTFDRSLGCWIVNSSPANITYLQNTFTEDQYEKDDDTKILFDYYKNIELFQKSRLSARLEYESGQTIPEIDFIPRTKSYNHQIVALHSIHRSPYFALLMGMGLGKTKIVIDEICWCAKNYTDGQSYKAIILAPKSIVYNWEAEFAKHCDPTISRKIVIGEREDKLLDQIVELLRSRAKIKILILNPQKLLNIINLSILLRVGPWDICVADESTWLKNPDAKVTKAALELRDMCLRRIIMTGTPNPNSVKDLWSQYQFLQSGALGFSRIDNFIENYCVLEGGFNRIVGTKNLDDLQKRMAVCSFVCKKEQVLPDLPPKTFTTHIISMGVKQREIYKQMKETLLAQIEALGPKVSASVVIVQLLRLAQITSGFVKFDDGTIKDISDGDGKIQDLEETIEQFEDHERFIIWARFRHDIVRISKLLEKLNINYSVINGDTPVQERQQICDNFNSEDHPIRVILATPSAAGLGLTMIGSKNRPCRYAYRYSYDFSLLNWEQAEDRCHRIGVHTPIEYITAVTEASIDEYIYKRLTQKKDQAEIVKDFSLIRNLLRS